MRHFSKLFIFSLTVFQLSVLNGMVSIVSELHDERDASPGKAYAGVISVMNNGDTQEEITIYLLDYSFNYKGEKKYNEPGTSNRSNADWVKFSPVRVSIPPHEYSFINFSVSVPPQDTLKGTYWSVLMVEPVSKSAELKRAKKGVGITTVVRYAYQIITNIQNTGTRKLQFINAQIANADTCYNLQIDIENTGDLVVRPKVLVDLYDSQGKKYGPFTGEQKRIYPGTSIRSNVKIKLIPEGTYRSVVVADCGSDDNFGITYTIKLEKKSTK